MSQRLFSIAALVAASLYITGCNSGALPATYPNIRPAGNFSLPSGAPLVYVSSDSNGTVLAFSEADNGDATPKIRLGADSQLIGAGALKVDKAGKLFVCCGPDGVNVYAPGARSGAEPIHMIGSPTTPFFGASLAVSRKDDVYVGQLFDSPGMQLQWVEGGASGCVTIHTIVGPHTDINSPQGLAVDEAGFVYAANGAPDFGIAGISVHAPEAVGDAAPVRFVGGPHTGLVRGSVWSVALDKNGLIYVLSQDVADSGGFISIFAHDANGDVPPIRVLSGPQSMLNGPQDIAVDRNNKIYVSNVSGNDITVYDANATGPLKPIQVIGGPHTGIGQPSHIAVSNAP